MTSMLLNQIVPLVTPRTLSLPKISQKRKSGKDSECCRSCYRKQGNQKCTIHDTLQCLKNRHVTTLQQEKLPPNTSADLTNPDRTNTPTILPFCEHAGVIIPANYLKNRSILANVYKYASPFRNLSLTQDFRKC